LKWDGLNLWPVLSGTGSLPKRSLYSAGTHFRSQALRHGDWKLIVFHNRNGTVARSELFNIASDPNEKHNLAESNPDTVADLKQKLEAAMTRDRDAVAQGDRGL
jgi:arylsulfatase A-like enzyme